jgi:hypothetical protein
MYEIGAGRGEYSEPLAVTPRTTLGELQRIREYTKGGSVKGGVLKTNQISNC